MASAVKVLSVIGAGQMGAGIAHTAAAVAKVPQVILFDLNTSQLEKQKLAIERSLAKDVNKQKISAGEKEDSMNRILFTNNLESISRSDFVIEAITENIDLKKGIFENITALVRPYNPNAIFASNTSSISITKLASFTDRPQKFVGMHFMNPVPLMQLVEIVKAGTTDAPTLAATLALAAAMKKATTISEDVPGFIANRLLMPYINEAIFALYENVATRDDIDKTMVLGTNVPMGPLRLADFIGLDTCLAIMEVLHRDFADSKYRPCPLLVRYVNAGWTGMVLAGTPF